MANEQRTIELADGRKLGFAEYGDPSGNPVLYFHGFPGSRLEAGRFHEVAVSNRYRLIGIDRPGMGLSSADKNRTLLSWTTDVANFADCLEIEKFSIIGHSGGAPFVVACAYAIPERLNGAAIVSGMAPIEKPESQIGMSRGQRIANSVIKNMPCLTTLMMRLTLMMLKNPNKMMKQMIKQLPEVDQALFRDPAIGKTIINSVIEAFRNGVTGPADEMKLLFKPWGFDLENVRYPITIWQGTLDKQVPVSHAKIYANLIPGAQLKMIANEGHHSLLHNHIDAILRGVCL
jgi:pimeloyl-ACP methyl ester carboxylesterase